MDKINVAVIGCGWAGREHLAEVVSFPEVGKVIGVDVSADALKACSERFGISTTQDVDSVAGDPDIGAVFIAAANHVHSSLSIACMEQGKHVMCEKPMALEREECVKMVETAQEKGVVLHVGFEMRMMPFALRTKEIIESGEIGDPVSFQRIHYRGPFRPDWKRRREDGGSMFLMETCHCIDLFRFWAGKSDEIERVFSAAPPNVFPDYEYPDTDFTTYWFKSGAVGHSMTSQARSAEPGPGEHGNVYTGPFGHQTNMSVTATKGSVHTNTHDGAELHVMNHEKAGDSIVCRLNRTEALRLPGGGGHFFREQDHQFIQAALGIVPGTYLDPEDACTSHLVCFAADESQRTNRIVEI